jgi:hypothetical protein
MGLRHNFAGSEDEANFYSDDEIKGLDHEHSHARKPDYSSIMDYSHSELNFLHVMGKYDVAALRYAYRREVELKSGKVVPVKGTLADMQKAKDGEGDLKAYSFCTDENVGINPGCRRFDEGTNLEAIAQDLVRSYEQRYLRSNFRNGRRNFSENDDLSYLSTVNGLMRDMRPFLETYDRIWKLFGGNPEKDPDFQSPEAADLRKFYLDLKKAVTVVRDAYVDTILTPAASCVIQFVAGPNSGKMTVVTSKQMGGTFKSCWEPRISELLAANGAVALGQMGKNFANEKSRASTNPWADQIDTRGIWGDKVLAVRYLVQRRLGVKSFDEYRGNFLDMTTYQKTVIKDGKPVVEEHTFDERMVEIIDSFLLDHVKAPVDVKLGDGSTTTIPEFEFAPGAMHWIPLQGEPALRKLFFLDGDDTPFAQAMLSSVLAKIGDTTPSASASAIRDYYGLSTSFDYDGKTQPDIYDLGDVKVFAQSKNVFARNVIRKIDAFKKLSKVKKERLPALEAIAKKGGKLPKDLATEEVEVVKLGSATITAFIAGELDDVATNEQVLRMVAKANLNAR